MRNILVCKLIAIASAVALAVAASVFASALRYSLAMHFAEDAPGYAQAVQDGIVQAVAGEWESRRRQMEPAVPDPETLAEFARESTLEVLAVDLFCDLYGESGGSQNMFSCLNALYGRAITEGMEYMDEDGRRRIPVALDLSSYKRDDLALASERYIASHGIGADDADAAISEAMEECRASATAMLDSPYGDGGAGGVSMAGDGWRYPVRQPVIYYGWGDYAGHRGTDFVSQLNQGWDMLYSMHDGVVAYSGYHHINGNFMLINDGNGHLVYYGHMKDMSRIPVGTYVHAGECIGYIGDTGRAFGPHCHVYVQLGGSTYEYGRARCDVCRFVDCAAIKRPPA